MKTTLSITELQNSALLFIEKNQNKNGGFSSKSITQLPETIINTKHTTIFYPALVGMLLQPLQCLRKVNKITEHIKEFLVNEATGGGIYSYWAKDDPYFISEPYPADLDDTARAFSVLYGHEATDPEQLANFALLLTKQEIQPGGPYFTWIKYGHKSWPDIDPVVNAAVYNTLHQNGILLESLEKFLVNCIEQNTWKSPYYVNDWFTLYLIFTSLSQDIQRKVQPIIQTFYKNNRPQNFFEECCKIILLPQEPNELLNYSQENFDDYPIVLEKLDGEAFTYSGCKVLTATMYALALQAISEQNQVKISAQNHTEDSMISDAAIKIVANKISKLEPGLHERGLLALANLMAKPVSKEILLLSADIGLALTRSISKQAYAQLGAANVFGWLAFMLYNLCYDEHIVSADLSLANILIRESVQQYTLVARELGVPETLITQVLDTVDQTYAQEQIDTAELRDALIHKKRWLGVQTRKISERSFGHCLGGLMIVCSLKLDSNTIKDFKKLFNHYITARQICDDLHDWPEDYSAIRITSATKSLFVTSQAFLNTDLFQAKKIFWTEGIDITIINAEQEIDQANTIFCKLFLPHKRPALLEQSIEKLKQSISQVKHERNAIKNMIHYFSEYAPISTVS